jgi:glutamate-1-semialdehyde 2,1-aminomutase
LRPYPLYVERAAGSRKWDVDGNEYVDYFGGHGALILGHCHPAVQEAVERQIGLGNHFGAEHEGALAWAEMIQEMVPGAERVRFTSSGTEATQLALRLARARTGRSKIVRFGGHFHGWHDHLAFSAPVSEANRPAGIPEGVVGEVSSHLHTGDLLGVTGMTVMALGCVMLAVMTVTGAILGWKRILILARKRADD